MAADILIYDSDVVPVGRDQKQHVEITRDLAMKMNETYGEILKLPEPRINTATELVPGLDGQKMSKSYGNTIDIFGEEKETRKRVMSIVTDSTPVEAPKNPEGSTIFQLYSLFATPDEIAEMRADFARGGRGYGDFKKQLFVRLWDYFAPMRNGGRRSSPTADYIDEVLARGAKRANAIADEVMDAGARARSGFVRLSDALSLGKSRARRLGSLLQRPAHFRVLFQLRENHPAAAGLQRARDDHGRDFARYAAAPD